MLDDRQSTEEPAQDPLEGHTGLMQQAARAQLGTAALPQGSVSTARSKFRSRRAALLRRAQAFQALTPVLLSEMVRHTLEQRPAEEHTTADEALTLDGEAVLIIDRLSEQGAADPLLPARSAQLDHLSGLGWRLFRWLLSKSQLPRQSKMDVPIGRGEATTTLKQRPDKQGDLIKGRGEAFASEE